MQSKTLARLKLAAGIAVVGLSTLAGSLPSEAVVYCRSGAYVRGCVHRGPAPAVRCGHVGYTRGCVVR